MPEDTRSGEDSREETAELAVDAGAEIVERLGESLGTWDMGWCWDLTEVGAGSSVRSPSLADRRAVSDTASASLTVLD